MPYNLHSDFNPKLHKQTFIRYLEVIIDENGKIMYAVPSHQEKTIKLACEKMNITREQLNAMYPEEYYFDFMKWLSKVSGNCAVWNDFVIGNRFSAAQIKSLQKLKDAGLYLGKIPVIPSQERPECFNARIVIDKIKTKKSEYVAEQKNAASKRKGFGSSPEEREALAGISACDFAIQTIKDEENRISRK